MKKIPWQDPLVLAQKVAGNYDDDWILLYSGLHHKIKKSFSYLALFPQEKIVTDDFSLLRKKLRNDDKRWFGYLSYELAQDFEKLPKTKKSFVSLPKIYLINFSLVLEFDHDKKNLTANYNDEALLKLMLSWRKKTTNVAPHIADDALFSNFTNESYLQTIGEIKKMIARGDLYQTNLTRKFFGEFAEKQNQQSAFGLFLNLTKLSPANYSSFLRCEKNFIISSSPELFLDIKNGKIISRPIKGTAPRGNSIKQDKQNKLRLRNSTKERAENLMIVDLVRNDLSRVCSAGSIAVKNLFKVTTYKNIHHMSSEIHGRLNSNLSTLDAIQTCFPPGSMTGTPKIKAMEIAAKKEKINRGIYSGSIGFLNGKKSANLSVVIRTLILQEKKFEFQTGGAITFDSNPQAELDESFDKAKALLEILNRL